MDKKQVIEKVKNYSDLVKNFLAVEEIILYGSYAKNNYHEYSDIDVAVIVHEISDSDYLDISVRLVKIGHQIDVMIEPVLIESSYDPSGFLEQIKNEGEVIYKQQRHGN